jgi:hypothetical protein
MKEKEVTHAEQRGIQRSVNDQLYSRRPEVTKKQATVAKRIVARVNEEGVNDLQRGSGDPLQEAGETLQNAPNVLDLHRWPRNIGDAETDAGFRGPEEMTKDNRFTPEQLASMDTVAQKCDQTIAAVNKFIENTVHPEDLPAVHGSLIQLSSSAQRYRTEAVATKKQMEILNATTE